MGACCALSTMAEHRCSLRGGGCSKTEYGKANRLGMVWLSSAVEKPHMMVQCKTPVLTVRSQFEIWFVRTTQGVSSNLITDCKHLTPQPPQPVTDIENMVVLLVFFMSHTPCLCFGQTASFSSQGTVPPRQPCWGSITFHVTLRDSESPPQIGGLTLYCTMRLLLHFRAVSWM